MTGLGQILNRKSRVTEYDTGGKIDPEAVIIRASMTHTIARTHQCGAQLGAFLPCSDNPAH
jgi:hypothetical protein